MNNRNLALSLYTSLDAVEGYTYSIFIKSERWLLADPEHLRAIEQSIQVKRANRFRSLMDYLFCELFPQFSADCQEYYNGKGKPLRQMVAPPEIRSYDEVLHGVFKILWAFFCSDVKISLDDLQVSR